jgi:integrase
MRVIIKRGVIHVDLGEVRFETKFRATSLSAPIVKSVYRRLRKLRKLYDTPELIREHFYHVSDGSIASYFREYVDTMEGARSRLGKPFSENTVRIYKSISAMLEKYERPLYLENYDMSGSVEHKRAVVKSWDAWFSEFIRHQKKRGHADKTIGERLNIISIVLRQYQDKMFVSLPKVPKVSFQDNPIVTLHPDFVKKFLTERRQFNAELQPIWELCATILVTSLRLSDALSLKESDFSDDFTFMRRMNQKTKAYTMMPIPSFLSDIYREHKIYSGPIDEVYDRIRELFSHYEEMQHMVDGKPMYATVHPHMLRKSAITTMLVNGVDREHVKFASGHSARSSAFEKYVGFVESTYHNQIGDYYKKLGV